MVAAGRDMSRRRLHPFDLVVRTLAERLQGCAATDELRAMVHSPGVRWERIVGYASAQYVLPALAAALRDLDLIGLLDAELGAFLRAVHAANLERNEELRAELTAAVGALNRAGIEPVLLKGAIRLVDNLYPDHGWRMLRDLDLLVPAATIADAVGALEQIGYARLKLGANELVRPGGLAQIDLHDELFSTLLPPAEIFERSRPARFGHGAVRLPAVEHQLVHLIEHSQIRHFGHAFGRIALRDRLEAAALLRWTHESIPWHAVSTCFVAAGQRRPLSSFVLALNDGGLCVMPAPGRTDLTTALQQRRIALQARSTISDYIGSRVGCWVSLFWKQIKEGDDGRPKGVQNLKRLITERGSARRMARTLLNRQQNLVQMLPYLAWLAMH
jgi:Uncharacterised nucleotidyltransferase